MANYQVPKDRPSRLDGREAATIVKNEMIDKFEYRNGYKFSTCASRKLRSFLDN